MKYSNLILEKRDFVKLKRILNVHRYYEDYAHKDALERLKERIEDALVQDEENVPDDVVRLNSKVTVISRDGKSQVFHLVPPSEENIKEGNISVISTLGANLIGLAVDDTVQIGIPSDFKSLKIIKTKRSHQLSSDPYSEIDF
ncbi:GreA/GreB family elongation factor [Costertonia aggregata]|uniref:GreA/GreB family elongation factor n=1 Tax=Costertonia aggregata TaxID=343403 RepID=A0A7H9ANI0_9FLAO|nr:GreA/GreB family elongation factor [Costertonia aggregata]QLG44954.1 GreA/GreB family elongation factor [Costertonia aggregata]